MPFDDHGRIDVEDLQREVEFAIISGVDGLGIAMASEIFKLSETERDLALKTVIQQARGRVKVVMHTGAQSTDLARSYSLRAESLGADAVMITPPNIFRVPSEEIIVFFKDVSEAISIPIFIQDIEGASVCPQLAIKITNEATNACYIKVEVAPTPPRIAKARRLDKDLLIIFGGAGGRALIEELKEGAVGTMPGCATPEMFRKVLDTYKSGMRLEAETILRRHAPLLDIYKESLDFSYHLTKELLRIRGIFKNTNVRRPTHRPPQSHFDSLRVLAQELNLDSSTIS
jgi:4-hydroxy-tetrahydrodipicolinate synthase